MYQIKGKIDTTNAAEFEKHLMAAKPAVIDASELEYISSAELRVLLKLAKAVGDVTINNVSNEVYEIFEVTGFTEILNVSKRLKEINIDNAVLLGAGANGRAYRLDDERIVKVYNKISNPPEKIRREQESARRAFVHGVPSAIPFELVTVGDELGMIYELVDANTLGSVVHNAPEKLREYALIRSLGGIVFSDVIPEEKRRCFSALIMKDLLGSIEKADMIIKAV